VQLSAHDGARLETNLRAGELDLAARVHPIPEGFDWQDVCTETLVVLLPRNHPLAGRKAVKLVRLAEFPFILFEEGFALNELILDACRSNGITPKIVARSVQTELIFELVSAGVGIAFVPRALVEQRPHRSVRHVSLEEPKCKWPIALAWRRGGYLSHAARAWLAHARDEHVNMTTGVDTPRTVSRHER
jgi:DNA-binding transcriptional LysR family regulator